MNEFGPDQFANKSEELKALEEAQRRRQIKLNTAKDFNAFLDHNTKQLFKNYRVTFLPGGIVEYYKIDEPENKVIMTVAEWKTFVDNYKKLNSA